MKPLLEIAEEAGLAATCDLQEGTPAGVILKAAGKWDAALIVLTARKQNPWSRLLFGPQTAEEQYKQAECHVMVLRNVPATRSGDRTGRTAANSPL